jgi:hypothetical protein
VIWRLTPMALLLRPEREAVGRVDTFVVDDSG